MPDHSYEKRAAAVREAQAAVHATAARVTDRRDPEHPATREWEAAISSFYAALARLYPGSLRGVDEGSEPASRVATADMLDFLEADPKVFRSGYLKEKLLKELKRRPLDRHESRRLQSVILTVIQKSEHRREFLRYCHAAVNVDDPEFRAELASLVKSGQPHVAQRARWALAGMDGRWLDLKRAATEYRYRDL